jgi:Na+/proline symporter
MILAIYAVVVFSLTVKFVRGYATDKTSFLLARRELGTLSGALSIAAVWTWAPAMFISAQLAYQNGIAGLFWFTIGNFLTLIVFAWFARRLRENQPLGFTLSGYVKHKFGERVQSLFLIESSVLAICAVAINVLAGSKAIETITGMSYHAASAVLTLLALAYVLRGGLKASVVTEIFKITILWIGIAILVPWAWNAGGGIDSVIAGLGGITGQGNSLFGNDFVLGIFMGMGLSTVLGHLGAPWADNSFYQRAFSIKQNSIIPAFIFGALIFLFIPLTMGSLGFLAAGTGLEIAKDAVGMTAIIAVGSVLPSWTLIVLIFMTFAGLVSVIDGHLSSASSIVGHDVRSRFRDKNDEPSTVTWARSGMIAVAAIGLIIANWPGMTLLTIFLFFAVMRATVWWPMMLHLARPALLNERGVFWGILLAFLIGMPIYLFGQFVGQKDLIMIGTLTAVFGSAALSLLITKLTSNTTK